jgi:DNA-binding transcriptional LysR family regulator
MDEVLARHRLERRIAITVPHFLVALAVVSASEHALTTPYHLVEAAAPVLPLRTIPLPVRPVEYAISQIWAERDDADEGHRWLRGAIRRALAKKRTEPTMASIPRITRIDERRR